MNLRNIQSRVEHLKEMLDPQKRKREKAVERKKGLVKGLALGTFIGGLVGVFYAPDKGENTRKRAKEELEKAKEVIQNNIVEGKEKFGDFYDEKKDVIGEKMVILKEKMKARENAAITDDISEDDFDRE
ncbi:YtxH domain-containing protein [Alkaliphilus serpentinus]|uniref:YtxH domain-containing protein n=1 Tax=Alkaliphilus serpentinus TaxID=1482731 RepID=A0A833HNB5_9FIRM|nr:YtxH domain-containing protein [Alkaliphilus serpentinus]KAB3529238.1 YtxH domain-containing protein [Alkaliphilus serpentinus]